MYVFMIMYITEFIWHSICACMDVWQFIVCTSCNYVHDPESAVREFETLVHSFGVGLLDVRSFRDRSGGSLMCGLYSSAAGGLRSRELGYMQRSQCWLCGPHPEGGKGKEQQRVQHPNRWVILIHLSMTILLLLLIFFTSS